MYGFRLVARGASSNFPSEAVMAVPPFFQRRTENGTGIIPAPTDFLPGILCRRSVHPAAGRLYRGPTGGRRLSAEHHCPYNSLPGLLLLRLPLPLLGAFRPPLPCPGGPKAPAFYYFFEQGPHHLVHITRVLNNDDAPGCNRNRVNFLVNGVGDFLAVVPRLPISLPRKTWCLCPSFTRPSFPHAEFGDHLPGNLGRPLKVIAAPVVTSPNCISSATLPPKERRSCYKAPTGTWNLSSSGV